MRAWLAGGLGLSLGWLSAAHGQEVQWHTAAPRPAQTAPASAPPVLLGRPVAIDAPNPLPFNDSKIQPAGFSPEQSTPRPIVRLQSPLDARPLPPGPPPPSWGTSTPGISANPAAVTVHAPPGEELYNNGVVTEGGPAIGHPGGHGLCCESGSPLFGVELLGNWQCFKSDHCFDMMISPITNPFLFEDPRALTELRPILIYQQSPGKNPIYQGGDLVFFGTQARVAITDRISLVMNKIGALWDEPHGGWPGFDPHVGLTELWFGPKYTWLRNENCGAVSAVGMTFQFASGASKVFQDTGDLSITPYITYGQNFLKSSYGSFNFMGTTGAAIRVDNTRSNYIFGSLHLDYDIANLHKIYPLIEMNMFHYYNNGKSQPLDFEGGDLINFGSTDVAGNNIVTMAAGVRYKFNENVQAGFAVEFPVTGQHDLMDYRLMVDFILRY